MKRFTLTILLLICLCFGCGNTDTVQLLRNIDTDLTLSAEDAVKPITSEVWEIIAHYRESKTRNYKFLLDRNPDSEYYQQQYKQAFSDAETLKALQEAYYTKHIDAKGIPVIAAKHVHPQYLVDARNAIIAMTAKHPNLLLDYFRGKFYISLDFGFYNLPETQDIPAENRSNLFATCAPRPYPMDGFITHLGNAEMYAGYCRCFPSQNYAGWNVIHEFAHALALPIGYHLDPTFRERLSRAYENAIENNLWEGYITINAGEYWAEGVAYYFHLIGDDRYFKTVDEFAAHDPLLYELLSEWFIQATLPRHSMFLSYTNP